MGESNYVETVHHLHCTNCGEQVVVGHGSRDTWYGMCECKVETLPRIVPEIDFEKHHVDNTGSIDWPVDSWERRAVSPYGQKPG